MGWLTDPLSSDVLQRALLAGVLAVITTSLVGTWIVVRGMTFMGDALAHGVLPGIALASIWGIDLVFGALLSAAVMVVGIHVVNRRTRLAEDTSIGLLFVGMLALGVIVISRSGSYSGDLTSFLFGDVLGVRSGDIWLALATAVATIVVIVTCYRPFLALSFNEDKAAVLGLRPRVAHVLMLTLVAVAIVASFRAVGTLLVFGLLVAPPATASLLVRRVPSMMVTACAIGVVSVTAGLVISYHADTAASATMAGVAVAVFFVVLAAREAAGALR